MNLRTPYDGGVQAYRGMGVVRYCLLCQGHRTQLGGFIKAIAGGRHWVCAQHQPKEKP